MSEYYLRRYDLNQAKNTIIRTGREVINISQDFRYVKYNLSGQKGLGIESIRRYLDTLHKQGKLTGGDIKDLGDLLNKIIRETEAADTEARKILHGLSVREQERINQAVRKIMKYTISFLLSLAGGLAGGNTEVAWAKNASDLLKVFNGGIDAKNSGEMIQKILESICKQIGKDELKAAGVTSAKASSIAGWAVEWFVNGVENFVDGDGNFFDDFRETLVEGLIGGGRIAGTAAASAAIVAALPIAAEGAAAVAIGAGVAIAVNLLTDYASNAFFHNNEGFVENTGDIVCDWMEQLSM